MSIRKLIIEDVRCFAGRQEFNIRPLTFLVGENSTGKSTVLGCFQVLHSFIGRNDYDPDLNFNIEPYQMGAFADIARRATPRTRSFVLGLKFDAKNKNREETVEYLLTLEEREKGSEPVVQEHRVVSTSGEIVFRGIDQEVDLSDERSGSYRHFEFIDSTRKGETKKFLIKAPPYDLDISIFAMLDISSMMLEAEKGKRPDKKEEIRKYVQKFAVSFRKEFFSERDWPARVNAYSFAPIRSKPQRTYDPLKESISPEGSDIPMMLMNMFRADELAWEELKEDLTKFGKSSGLFTDIHVRRLGKSMGDPFQLQIKVKGPKANMIDVGYGVNQLLPILVRMFNSDPRTTFLMQQPEVHLHPKGQAELSSLLVDLVKQREHKFIVETHSDHMVDRARIEIMKKRISPEDVSLIYLEPAGNSVKVHNIEFDGQANLIGAPGSYREFFLKESDKLLGFG